MGSQTDLDQGGTFRQYQRIWLGPSVGWITFPASNVLPITAAGTTTAVIGTTLITVNVAALVTIQLWNPAVATVPAGVLPGDYIAPSLTVVDTGGNAASFNITILPAAGHTIIGLASIAIVEAYGAWTLNPDINTGNWTLHS